MDDRQPMMCSAHRQSRLIAGLWSMIWYSSASKLYSESYQFTTSLLAISLVIDITSIQGIVSEDERRSKFRCRGSLFRVRHRSPSEKNRLTHLSSSLPPSVLDLLLRSNRPSQESSSRPHPLAYSLIDCALLLSQATTLLE